MVKVGFHASHEQWPPSALARMVQQAERAGFQAAMCSDHFHPWSQRQGHSGFSFAWLGAAMQATSLSFGTVCAPGPRYHPAVVAQAAATLEEMFPGRFWLALGSGEALNESITGEPWPTKPERNARLKEAADVIRALWAGETVNHQGRFTVRDATLYSRPKAPPLLYGAAVTPETARWLGGWADGLITVGASREALKRLVEAFQEGGGEGKPMSLQAAVSFAPTRREAINAAHDQWRHAALGGNLCEDLATPAQFDAASAHVPPEELEDKLRIADDVESIREWIDQAAELGFDHVYLHNVARNPSDFIGAFGEKYFARHGTTS